MTDQSPQREFAEARAAILAAALPHMAFDGWSRAALARGARDAGYDDVMAERAFPGGVRDLIRYHLAEADRQMLAALAETDLAAMRVRDRVAFAVKLRLQQHQGEREAIRRAMNYLAQPQNGALGLRALYKTVDAIWYAAGDTSTDFNFYTKRGLLAGVYSATLLYWLADTSAECAATWVFLDRRLDDVMRVPKITGRLRAAATMMPSPLRFFRRMATRA